MKKVTNKNKANNTGNITVEEKMKPIIFQNKPINSEDKDLFDYSYQKEVLNTAIDNDARIIGIVGDYGTGKSSITKLVETDRKIKGDKIININLWGELSQKKEDNERNPLIKSFLYQLAYANNKKNTNFAKYINARFNKNNGKMGLAVSTRKIFIILGIATVFYLLYFSCNSLYMKLPTVPDDINIVSTEKWFNFISFLSIGKYISLVIGVCLSVLAVCIAAPVFSSWKSEGKYEPDNSDVYEIYLRIINRLLPCYFKQKCIVFIDDLDRTTDKALVVTFLKEIYKYLHLLPDEKQKRIVFVISLKSEVLLKLTEIPSLKTQEADTKNFYSKIFDYTLSIKQIHSENYRDIVESLIFQEKDSVINVYSQENKIENKEKIIIQKIVSELKWIYSDENITIREIKERLNETFLLYQTLLHRNYENPSIQLQKCAAVVFLKRKFPEEYDALLKKEKYLAQLIRECNKEVTSEKKEKVYNQNIKNITEIEESGNSQKINIPKELKTMIFEGDIEDDFSMYLYNYPKNSYVKNSNEKELFDALIHDDISFLKDKYSDDVIDEVITDKKGRIIDEAYSNYLKGKIPEIVYENEKLFCYTVNHFNEKQKLIEENIKEEITVFLADISKNIPHVEKILSYNTDNYYKQKLSNTICSQLKEKMIRFQPAIIENIRKSLLEIFKNNTIFLVDNFTDENLPQLSIDTFNSIKYEDVKIKILDNFSEKQLQTYDEKRIKITNEEQEDVLFERKCIISLLLHYADANKLESFNFKETWVPKKIMEVATKICELDQNSFIKIRKAMKNSCSELPADFYKLFIGNFPIIESDELKKVKIIELYTYLKHTAITIDNCNMLSEYCNYHGFTKDNLFTFFESLFFHEDSNISNQQIIKKIFSNIDFNKIKFSSLTSEQQDTVFVNLKSVYDLDTFEGALEFMRTTKTLIEKFEKDFTEEINNNTEYFNKYLELLNELKQCTSTSLTIIRDKRITIPLEPEITNLLFDNKYFIRYIIGKTLYDKSLTYNKQIPLIKYYKVFITSDECLNYFIQNGEIIKDFYDQKMYLQESTPLNRLEIWYKSRQPIELITTILKSLQNDVEKQKEYLKQITDINEEKDVYKFIDLILTDSYSELLRDESLFWYLWHKMWNKYQKQVFTKRVNQKLGTKYRASEMKE